jgi:hypothetical protein
MRLCHLLVFLLFPACDATCNISVPLADLLQVFQAVIPTTDGSVLASAGVPGTRVLLNIRNNVRALGGMLECGPDAVCVLSFPVPHDVVKVSMAAILGNFMNDDLDLDDALAHIRVDPVTGLLRRVHTSWWLRLVIADTLLVLAVIMLGRRAFVARA